MFTTEPLSISVLKSCVLYFHYLYCSTVLFLLYKVIFPLKKYYFDLKLRMNNENNLCKPLFGIIFMKKKLLSKSDNLKRRLCDVVLNLVSINNAINSDTKSALL